MMQDPVPVLKEILEVLKNIEKIQKGNNAYLRDIIEEV